MLQTKSRKTSGGISILARSKRTRWNQPSNLNKRRSRIKRSKRNKVVFTGSIPSPASVRLKISMYQQATSGTVSSQQKTSQTTHQNEVPVPLWAIPATSLWHYELQQLPVLLCCESWFVARMFNMINMYGFVALDEHQEIPNTIQPPKKFNLDKGSGPEARKVSNQFQRSFKKPIFNATTFIKISNVKASRPGTIARRKRTNDDSTWCPMIGKLLFLPLPMVASQAATPKRYSLVCVKCLVVTVPTKV